MPSLADEKKRIKHVAIEIASMTRSDLSYFFSVFFDGLPEDKRKQIIDIVAGYYFEDAGKWLRIDKWMESCFIKHSNYTPKKVGSMCCKYFKINYRMMPALLQRAKKSKDRVRHRLKYSEQKEIY